MAGVLLPVDDLGVAAEDIGDQAQQMVWLVEKSTDMHPVLGIALGDTDDIVVRFPVAAGSTADGKSLKPLFTDLKNAKKGYGREEFYQFYGKLGYKGFHNFATWASLRKGDYKLHYDYQGKV